MSFDTFTLLADGDWFEMIWPILLMVGYGAVALVKMFAERTQEKRKEAEEKPQASLTDGVAKPRYRPLGEVARPRPETPQARTLPYARTAAKSQPPSSPPNPAGRPAETMSEWDRQQQIKKRRLEQIEALRRQQAVEEQRRRIQQQAALQGQREQQQRQQQMHRQQQATPPAVAKRPGSQSAAAVRKTPQEAMRQARTGQPVGGGVSRHSVLLKSAAAPVQRVAQAGKAAPRPEVQASVSGTLRAMLGRRDSLRSAFVLKEILDVPVGLRDV